MKFDSPLNEGLFNYNVFLICDSWVGCDIEEKVAVKVIEEESNK